MIGGPKINPNAALVLAAAMATTLPRTPAPEKQVGMYNPLLRFPRNNPCFCGSKKKAKKCCLNRVARVCGVFDGNRVKENWDKILRGEILIKG